MLRPCSPSRDHRTPPRKALRARLIGNWLSGPSSSIWYQSAPWDPPRSVPAATRIACGQNADPPTSLRGATRFASGGCGCLCSGSAPQPTGKRRDDACVSDARAQSGACRWKAQPEGIPRKCRSTAEHWCSTRGGRNPGDWVAPGDRLASSATPAGAQPGRWPEGCARIPAARARCRSPSPGSCAGRG